MSGTRRELQKVPYILDTRVNHNHDQLLIIHILTLYLLMIQPLKLLFILIIRNQCQLILMVQIHHLTPEQDIINASYIQEYPDSQEMRFRIPYFINRL